MRVVRKWELTRAALDGLLARLDTNPSVAGEKYEQLRRGLLNFFSWHGTAEPDSSVDETLDRLARRLNDGQTIDDVQSFAYGVAKLIRFERQRQSAAVGPTSPITDEEIVAAPPSKEEDEVRDACLHRCLGELSHQERDLIVRYYVGTGRERIDGRSRLAVTLGVSENALRHRALRLRERLRTCAAGCLERAG